MQRCYLNLIVLTSCLAGSLPTRAEVLEFTLDPARSRLHVSSGLAPHGEVAQPQSPGSDDASYTGTLRVELGSGTIRFLDDSFADALPQAVPQQPGPGGAAGAAPSDYGFFDPAPPARHAALRDVAFDFFSNPIPTMPLSNGGLAFNASVFSRVRTGRTDYTLPPGGGSFDFAGPNTLPGDDDPVATLTTDGLLQTLTLPYYTTLVHQVLEADGDYYQFRGDLVATRLVPEPAHAGALACTAGFLLASRRRSGRAELSPSGTS